MISVFVVILAGPGRQVEGVESRDAHFALSKTKSKVARIKMGRLAKLSAKLLAVGLDHLVEELDFCDLVDKPHERGYT